MDASLEVRIDKWLWSVRVFKTRTLAATACRGGHVEINGQKAKPSHVVKLGEVIRARTGEITRTVRVLALLERRVSASAARQFAEDLTPPEEYQKPREVRGTPFFMRRKGLGRPTKKDRRDLIRVMPEDNSASC